MKSAEVDLIEINKLQFQIDGLVTLFSDYRFLRVPVATIDCCWLKFPSLQQRSPRFKVMAVTIMLLSRNQNALIISKLDDIGKKTNYISLEMYVHVYKGKLLKKQMIDV